MERVHSFFQHETIAEHGVALPANFRNFCSFGTVDSTRLRLMAYLSTLSVLACRSKPLSFTVPCRGRSPRAPPDGCVLFFLPFPYPGGDSVGSAHLLGGGAAVDGRIRIGDGCCRRVSGEGAEVRGQGAGGDGSRPVLCGVAFCHVAVVLAAAADAITVVADADAITAVAVAAAAIVLLLLPAALRLLHVHRDL